MDKEASDSSASYLLALCEKELTSGVDGKANLHYGIAFVDAAVGKFVVGEFEDDRLCSRLRTLLAHWPPEQILVGKGDKMITPKTLRLLKVCIAILILFLSLLSASPPSFPALHLGGPRSYVPARQVESWMPFGHFISYLVSSISFSILSPVSRTATTLCVGLCQIYPSCVIFFVVHNGIFSKRIELEG